VSLEDAQAFCQWLTKKEGNKDGGGRKHGIHAGLLKKEIDFLQRGGIGLGREGQRWSGGKPKHGRDNPDDDRRRDCRVFT